MWLCSFADVCSSCSHVVATHEYTFKVEGQYQVYNTFIKHQDWCTKGSIQYCVNKWYSHLTASLGQSLFLLQNYSSDLFRRPTESAHRHLILIFHPVLKKEHNKGILPTGEVNRKENMRFVLFYRNTWWLVFYVGLQPLLLVFYLRILTISTTSFNWTWLSLFSSRDDQITKETLTPLEELIFRSEMKILIEGHVRATSPVSLSCRTSELCC